MKKHLLLALTFTAGSLPLWAQLSYNDVGRAAGMFAGEISNSIKEGQTNKMLRQKQSLQLLQGAVKELGEARYDNAFGQAEQAMIQYPKYSLSYLVMAYTALQNDDYVNSNRMLQLYHKYNRKAYNRNLNLTVPGEFVQMVKEKNEKGFASLSQESKTKQYSKEPWLNNSLVIKLTASALFLSDEASRYTGYGTQKYDAIPEIISDNTLSLLYTRNFWFSRGRSLPFTNNNFGLSLTGGVDVNLDFPNTYFPGSYKAHITPGLFMNKVYFSPGQLRYQRPLGYQQRNDNTDIASAGVIFSPEVRWYLGVLNAYATDMRQLSQATRSSGKFGFGYLLFRLGHELYAGYKANASNGQDYYKEERVEFMFGFSGYAGKRRTTEFGFIAGPGGINNPFADGDYWRVGLSISKRIL
ncbi:hypothetical protein [Chitinophaga qingshengii]|uniref:YaiO family outer membrane beta-barrel protein n=1 Tax=Chitinophaga qingshengii TaxID=1569794 RepID=A0ABR7TH05_9BACT|nr:hypothetical protein [Chitinophaga qingshengii]MBC9929766.1 hypothetical protein [Chitinophaga qingshengii]